MDKGKKIRIIVLILILLLITICLLSRCAAFYTAHNSAFGPVKSPKNVQCEHSFNDFAFTIPDFNQSNYSGYSGFPIEAPWKKIDDLPNSPSIFTENQIKGVSYFNNSRQIWIAERPIRFKLINKVILSYDIDTGEWKTFSNAIGLGNYAIYDLTINKSGDVFGLIVNAKASYYSKNVALCRYDEAKQKFVPLAKSDLPLRDLDNYSDIFILPEKDGNIWIVRANDAIYRYDLALGTLYEVISIAERGFLAQAIWTSSYQILLYFPNRVGGYSEKDLVLFDTQSSEFIEIEFQNKTIYQSRLFYDSNDNLWVGAFGKLDTDKKWRQFLPFPGILRRSGIYDHHILLFFNPPHVTYESSDEKLWFTMYPIYDSPTYRTGLAWYDPNTKEGCWSASGTSSIIEDHEGYMWLLANGALFKAKLSDIDGR